MSFIHLAPTLPRDSNFYHSLSNFFLIFISHNNFGSDPKHEEVDFLSRLGEGYSVLVRDSDHISNISLMLLTPSQLPIVSVKVTHLRPRMQRE